MDLGKVLSHADFVCAECRYAQLFALQPRALCHDSAAALSGRVLFAGQPACVDFVPQRGVDVRLSRHDWSTRRNGSRA